MKRYMLFNHHMVENPDGAYVRYADAQAALAAARDAAIDECVENLNAFFASKGNCDWEAPLDDVIIMLRALKGKP